MIIHWDSKLAKTVLPKKYLAITFGKHVFLKKKDHEYTLQEIDRLIRHEKKHVEQYQRYGFIGFLIRYIFQWIKYSYDDMPLEIEARQAELKEEKEYASI